jgi:hypothetical protein
MTLIRNGPRTTTPSASSAQMDQRLPAPGGAAPPMITAAPDLEQMIRAWHQGGHSQRTIARQLGIDRRKVKRILDRPHRVMAMSR